MAEVTPDAGDLAEVQAMHKADPTMGQGAWQAIKRAGMGAENVWEKDVAPVGSATLSQGTQQLLDLPEELYSGRMGDVLSVKKPGAVAQTVGGMFPQTIPDAAIDALSFYLGGGGFWKGARNIAALAGTGALTAPVFGKDPWTEGERGAFQGATGEALRFGLNKAAAGFRMAGETKLGQARMRAWGKKVGDLFPFLKKSPDQPALQTSEEIADHFIRGQALAKGRQNLGRNLNDLVPYFRNQTFNVYHPDVTGRMVKTPMLLPDANDAMTELNKQGFLNRTGQPKEGANADAAREMVRKTKNEMVAKMNKLFPGKGTSFATARSAHDAMHVLTDVFQKNPGGGLQMFHPQGDYLLQEPMLRQLQRYSPDLQRSMSLDDAKSLEQALTSGEKGMRRDLPGREGEVHGAVGVNLRMPHQPFHARVKFPKAPKPVGTDLPLGMRLGERVPAFSKLGAMGTTGYLFAPNSPDLSAAIAGPAYADTPPDMTKPQAMSQIEDLQNRQIAPVPSGAQAAGKITNKMLPGKKPPDISSDLDRGRLSPDGVKKLLQRSSSTNPADQVAGVSLPDLMGAAEGGTASEKTVLVPLIGNRLRQELPSIANKTMQANLSRRFANLQRDATPMSMRVGSQNIGGLQ